MKALARAAHGNTLKQSVSTSEAFAGWLGAAWGRIWPEVAHYIDYIKLQVTPPSASSWPGAFHAAVLRFESRTDRPSSERFGGCEALRRCIDWARVELYSEGKEVAQAPLFLSCMIVSLQLMVGDVTEPLAVPVTAWVRPLEVTLSACCPTRWSSARVLSFLAVARVSRVKQSYNGALTGGGGGGGSGVGAARLPFPHGMRESP